MTQISSLIGLYDMRLWLNFLTYLEGKLFLLWISCKSHKTIQAWTSRSFSLELCGSIKMPILQLLLGLPPKCVLDWLKFDTNRLTAACQKWYPLDRSVTQEDLSEGASFSSHFSGQTMKCFTHRRPGEARHRKSFKPQTLKGGSRACGVARNAQCGVLKHPLWAQRCGEEFFNGKTSEVPQLYFQRLQSARRKGCGSLVNLHPPTPSGPPEP